MSLVIVVVLSCILQLIAAILAIRLMPITEKKLAWGLISTALFLMALRRALSLYHLVIVSSNATMDPIQEDIGLLLSVLMVFGIAWISPIFDERNKVEDEIRKGAQDLVLLNKLNSAVNQGETLDQVVHLLTKEAKRVFGSIGTTIYLLNEQRDYLIMAHKPARYMKEIGIEQFKQHDLKEVEIKLIDGGVYRELIDSGKNVITNDGTTIQRMMAECTENPALKKLVPLVYKALPISSVMSVPLIHDGMCIGLMDSSRRFAFTHKELDRFAAMGQQITVILKRYEVETELFHRAMYDSLTDVANRLVIDDALRRAVALARRDSSSVLIFLDADRFKNVNDNLGHIAGDQVLRCLAQRVKSTLRAEDILARVGGDEFAILMEGSTLEDGQATIERIENAVSEIQVPMDGGEMGMSCSCGMVLIDGTLEPDRLLAVADQKMYENKRQKPTYQNL